jgi:hypothetical protein
MIKPADDPVCNREVTDQQLYESYRTEKLTAPTARVSSPSIIPVTAREYQVTGKKGLILRMNLKSL